MAFWNRWFGAEDTERSRHPDARDETAKQVSDERPEAAPEEQSTCPVDAPEPSHSTTAAASVGWFERDEILELGDIREEAELLRRLGQKLPSTSREEILFRYHLSRRVRLADFELPVLPASATQVLALGRNPSAEISEYVRVIGADPALVRPILDTAGSTFFASLSEAKTLDQAIVRIGLLQVEQIVLVHTMRSRLLKVPGFDDLAHSVVAHCQRVGIAAQVIARRDGVPAADAFLAGLFHDVGKLLLLAIVAQVQNKLSWRAPLALVLQTFEAFHVILGQLAAESWELPEDTRAAVAHHHDRERARSNPIARSVWLGNLLSRVWDEAPEDESTLPQGPWLTAEAQIDDAELAELIEAVERELQAYEAIGLV